MIPWSNVQTNTLFLPAAQDSGRNSGVVKVLRSLVSHGRHWGRGCWHEGGWPGREDCEWEATVGGSLQRLILETMSYSGAGDHGRATGLFLVSTCWASASWQIKDANLSASKEKEQAAALPSRT